ncbi:MAG: hypothetical protein GY856_51620, partial [bacterium]|nr:hypothetical protein [bacterium]
WSKQVALPLVVVLPAWVWLTEGWRRAVRFLVCLAVCGALVSAVILWLFGPVENVLFNLWTVPRNQVTHPSGRMWDLVGAFRRHIKETALLGVLVVVTAVLELRRHAAQGSSGGRLRAVPGMLFALVGLSFLPGALLAFRKPGGDVNAMSYDSYFLLAAVTLSLTGLAQASTAPRRLVAAARGLLVTLPGLVLLTVVLWQESGCLSSWRRPVRLAELPSEVAYEYARRHPGEVYFPRLTLASYLAEGRVDHQSAGLIDRKVAGVPLSPGHLRAHLPPRLRAVAMVENGFIGERGHLGLPEYSLPVEEPELPGFVVFERREAAGRGP